MTPALDPKLGAVASLFLLFRFHTDMASYCGDLGGAAQDRLCLAALLSVALGKTAKRLVSALLLASDDISTCTRNADASTYLTTAIFVDDSFTLGLYRLLAMQPLVSHRSCFQRLMGSRLSEKSG